MHEREDAVEKRLGRRGEGRRRRLHERVRRRSSRPSCPTSSSRRSAALHHLRHHLREHVVARCAARSAAERGERVLPCAARTVAAEACEERERARGGEVDLGRVIVVVDVAEGGRRGRVGGDGARSDAADGCGRGRARTSAV